MLFVKDTPQGVQIINATAEVLCTVTSGTQPLDTARMLVRTANQQAALKEYLEQMTGWLELLRASTNRDAEYFNTTAAILRDKGTVLVSAMK